MAFGDGVWHLPTALVALWGAFMIHIGTNLTNDYYDLKKGADKIGEIDPMRVIPVGHIKPKTMKIACWIAFLMVIPPCIYLINRAGWPIILIGIFSVLAGFFYTAGKNSLGYMGCGDLLVLIFFGPVALAGTYYAQSLEMNLSVVLAGLAPGLFSMCVLTINNIRDFDIDRQVNKRTLVVRLGKAFGRYEYVATLFCISLLPTLIYILIRDHIYILLCGVIIFPAIPIIKTVFIQNDELNLNLAIGSTIKLLLIYTLTFSICWII